MSNYIDTGAFVGTSSVRVKSKAELKRLVMAGEGEVTFDPTSPFSKLDRRLSVADLDDYTVFSVVGPDPSRDRKWYASVKLTRNGPRVS